MKKILLTMACAGAITVSAFAQLLDEKNVTITMDLQPVLQLSMQGPDQIDFTFDNIASYYSGITKYGANILKISASVSFDLWATGQSQTTNFLWDSPVQYQGGNTGTVSDIPITALELRQYPPNPSITTNNISTTACAVTTGALSDYSSAFAAYNPVTATFAAGSANNNIYTAPNLTPYLSPTTLAAAGTEKYIAGGTGTAAGCQMIGGSYLMQSNAALTSPTSGAVGSLSGYYFVMDYRILPGLPAQFPSHETASTPNADLVAGQSNFEAEAATTLGDATTNYAAPGVYTMYVKYILVEDQ